MNQIERIKMVRAMEFIARQVNNEDFFFDWWLTAGVADGDIEYGALEPMPDDADNLAYYISDGDFAELMHTFLYLMNLARKDGGLYCDRVVSK